MSHLCKSVRTKIATFQRWKKGYKTTPSTSREPKSKRFAEDRDEIMSEAIWSHFETILPNELCTALLDQPTNKTKVYNNIVDYSTSLYCLAVLPDDIVLRKKTLNEVTSKINYQHQPNSLLKKTSGEWCLVVWKVLWRPSEWLSTINQKSKQT